MECCSQISVSGSWITASEKVDKSLQLLSGKCMAEYCLLTLSLSLIIIEVLCKKGVHGQPHVTDINNNIYK